MGTIERNRCPFCLSKDLEVGLTVVDSMVSQESFNIVCCRACGGAFTQHAPDKNSIGKYYKNDDYISHTDTQRGIINKIYHRVRQRMLQKKVSWVRRNSEGNTVVDIGAGTGYFVDALVKKGFTAFGYEPDAFARNVAEKRGTKLLPAEDLANIKESSIDAITLWHVLEHVHDLDDYMSLFHRALKTSGTLFIALPNLLSYDAKTYKSRWKAWDVPKHLWHFSPAALEALANRFDFAIIGKKTMPFDPFYISLLSEAESFTLLSPFRAAFVSTISFFRGLLKPDAGSSVVYILKKKAVG